MSGIRQVLGAAGRSWLRFLKPSYRRAVRALQNLVKGATPSKLQERLQLIDRIIGAQAAQAAVQRSSRLGAEAFGRFFRHEDSDWHGLRAVEQWERRRETLRVPPEFRGAVGSVKDKAALANSATALAHEIGRARAEVNSLFASLKLDPREAFGPSDVKIAKLADRLREWHASPGRSIEWIRYRSRVAEAQRLDLGAVVERIHDGRLDPEVAADSLEVAYYDCLMREIVAEHPQLAHFDGVQHQRLVSVFQRLDRESIKLARAQVASSHFKGMPGSGQDRGQVGILRGEFAIEGCESNRKPPTEEGTAIRAREEFTPSITSAEVNKRRRHLPVRQLIHRAGLAIQALKPVFMMSPLSIAQFLEPGSLDFDLLLIDEASQILPVDALGAIARVRQVVVVGDKKQLPPTRFFSRLIGEDDTPVEDDQNLRAGDVQSILELCEARGAPQTTLRWHYRSEHHSLIAVSNKEFYKSRLYVAPTAHSDDPERGLRFRYLSAGVFDRGGSATNRLEAKALASAVLEHARKTPDLTLGVGCFSVQQRDAILDELEHLWREAPDVQAFFASDKPEPFFVKNLENVQGDERDVVFISIGYGKDKDGFFSMNFGPLNSDGGERRLNVLITRARKRCEVFSSVHANELDLQRARSCGAAALKTFLQYAETGLLDVAAPTERDFDSPFEEAVANELVRLGFDVTPQVGVAGFFIDLAIRDSDRPGRYLLGIECDGAAYHSSRSARDRDRLRQEVLEAHGWIIHRIWSADWFLRPDDELRRLLGAVERARAVWATRSSKTRPSGTAAVIEEQDENIEREDSREKDSEAPGIAVVMYLEASFRPSWREEPHLVRPAPMGDAVIKIIEVEGPIHEDEIARRVTTICGLQRTGNRITSSVNRGLSHAVRRGAIVADGPFYRVAGPSPVIVRDRSNVSSATLRRPEMLPPAEIREAVTKLAATHIGISRDETILEVSRLLGFKATSGQLREIIAREIEGLLAAGVLNESREHCLSWNAVTVH